MTARKGPPPALQEAPAVVEDEDELYEMANLYPRTTGLPMTVWVSVRGRARHDVRIKVNLTHGNRMSVDNTAVIAVRPSPHVVAGRLSSEDEESVFRWIALNEATIVSYWDGDIDTLQLVQALVPLS